MTKTAWHAGLTVKTVPQRMRRGCDVARFSRQMRGRWAFGAGFCRFFSADAKRVGTAVAGWRVLLGRRNPRNRSRTFSAHFSRQAQRRGRGRANARRARFASAGKSAQVPIRFLGKCCETSVPAEKNVQARRLLENGFVGDGFVSTHSERSGVSAGHGLSTACSTISKRTYRQE